MPNDTPRFPAVKIQIQLTEPEGNAFAIVNKVSNTLKTAGIDGRTVEEFVDETYTLFESGGDYDQLKKLCERWVTMEWK